MTERRYDEDEVAAIFADAANVQERTKLPAKSPASGMTLDELKAIGREVGLEPEAIARAAARLDQKPARITQRFLGLPLAVGRSVELERRLTDQEWERLVVDLRETFDARGRLSEHGSFRQWTNGNLQVLLEPAEKGHRLRLRTIKGSARAYMLAGLGTLGVGAVTTIGAAIGGAIGNPSALSSMAAIGLGLFGMGALQLPGWARRRLEQMDGIVERTTRMAALPPPDPPGDDDTT